MIIDKSTENERNSLFYKKSKEIVENWKSIANELSGKISGNFNVYQIVLKIETDKFIIKGNKQQFTAQDSNPKSQNSRHSESTKFNYRINKDSNYIKIFRPNWIQNVMHKFTANKQVTLNENFTAISNSTAYLRKVKNSLNFQNMIEHQKFKYLKQEPNLEKLEIHFSNLIQSKEEFKIIYDIIDGIKKETSANFR